MSTCIGIPIAENLNVTMLLCDFLNRAAGLEGWQDLKGEARYELENLYFAQLKRQYLSEVTSLAMVDNIWDSDNILGEEDLRAQIFKWSSLPKVEYVFNPRSGKDEAHVVLTALKYGQSDRASEEKLERERPRDVSTGGRAASEVVVGSVRRYVPVNCGTSEGKRRRRKLKLARQRAQKERYRKKKREEELKSKSESRKSSKCWETVVDTFNGRGKSVSKASVDKARVKLLREKYDPKAHHGDGEADGPIQKLLLSARIRIRKECPQLKGYKKLSQEEMSADQQSRLGRMKWNSGWRKATMYEAGVQRKKKPAGAQSNARPTDDKKQRKGADTEKGLATEKRDSDSGKTVIDSLLHCLLDDVMEKVEPANRLVMPNMTDDESVENDDEEKAEDMNVEDEELAGLTDSEDEEEGEESNSMEESRETEQVDNTPGDVSAKDVVEHVNSESAEKVVPRAFFPLNSGGPTVSSKCKWSPQKHPTYLGPQLFGPPRLYLGPRPWATQSALSGTSSRPTPDLTDDEYDGDVDEDDEIPGLVPGCHSDWETDDESMNVSLEEKEAEDESPKEEADEVGGGDHAVVTDDANDKVMRLKGGADVLLTEDFDGFRREEVIEILRSLNIEPDQEQNINRLRKMLQQRQISNFISEQTPSTIVQVLKRYNLPWKRTIRREATLKQHFLGNPDLQQRILDDIVECSVLSPISSEAESQGTPKSSNTPSGADAILSPCSTSTVSPGTPTIMSPHTPGRASNSTDQLWLMSRPQLISFLSEEKGGPIPTNKVTEVYRDKVGLIMVDRLLEKLNSDRQELNSDPLLTEVMDNLKIEYRRDLDRRVNILRTHFKKKEDGKKQMERKQQAVLRELQLAVARKNCNIFTFPSRIDPSDCSPGSLPSTSGVQLSKQPGGEYQLQPPPKRKRISSPGTVPNAVAVVDQSTQVKFDNPSTYCYLNALLNLLFSNPEVMRVLRSGSTEQQVRAKGNGSEAILLELRRLSQIPVTGDALLGDGVVGEYGNVTHLKQLLGNQWALDTQEDAHDLFTELYTRLSCNNLEDMFQVVFQTERQCMGPTCLPVHSQEYCACLMLQPQGSKSMMDMYRSMCQKEPFDYPCHCGTAQSNREKQMALSGTAMVVVLERYRFNQEGSVRNDTPIEVPLSMYMNRKRWHLTGALKNSSFGNSTSIGHYTGIRRVLTTGKFFRNNDSAPLEELQPHEALHFISKSYMIMYCAEENLPGRQAPPVPTVEEGPGGDLPNVPVGQNTPVTSKRIRTVDDAGDHAENPSSVSAGTMAPPARKKTAGAARKKGAQVKQLANDFHPPEEEMAEIREYVQERKVHLEAREARIRCDDFSWHGLPRNPLLENLVKFEAELDKFKPVKCRHCDEKLYDVKLTPKTKMCPKCKYEHERRTKGEVRKWSAENNMHVDQDVPDELKNLTPVEQSAIQRQFTNMNIYRLARGATFLKGHCLSVHQDISEFATRLPLRPADLPMIFLIAPNQRIPLKANANKILAALRWLKKNNPFYEDLEIDFEALKAYPSNDNDFVEGLCTMESATVDEEPDPADAYTGEEGADIVYTSVQNDGTKTTVKEDIKRYVLAEEGADIPQVEWPHRSKKPADENARGSFSRMFPWLFPTGKGDITVMGPAGTPQYLPWLKHLLNHESRRFAQDQRFIHYAVNRHQKLQALTLGNCFVEYRNSSVTVEQLKEQVANDNFSTFSSLLYFARNIVGSRQFFRAENRKALSLVNFIHIKSDMRETMNLFVTLSFADLHDPALHRLFDESVHYLGKTVVTSLADIPAGGQRDDYILAAEDHRLRTEAVEKNGDIVCKYLNKKLWLFFDHVLRPMGVIDYILRVEFQYRSSEHFHMVLRLLDGVPVEDVHRAFTASQFEVKGVEKLGKLSPEEQEQLLLDHNRVLASRAQIAEFSTLRIGQTAIHPQKDPKQWPPTEGLNKEKPKVNCLRRQFSDVVAGPNNQITFPFQVPVGKNKKQLDQQPENMLADEATAQRIIDDVILMVNRLQLHKCTKRYCLKIVSAAVLLCKFHFPKLLVGFTAEELNLLYTKVHNEMENHAGAVFDGNVLQHARNHPRIVETISEFLLGWRGNTNTRFVESVHQLIEYLLKYIMKATAGSMSFANTVKDITIQTADDAKVTSVFQKLLMRNITEHDMSRTEAFRIALGMDFVFYSRKFRNVNLMGLRMVVKGDECDGETGAVRKATKDNMADIYWRRDKDSNFADLVEQYNAGNIVLDCPPQDINLYDYVASFEPNWTPSRETYVPVVSPLHHYPPNPRDPKKADNRKDYLRTQLLLFKPGMTPSRLPDDLEDGMRAFVQTSHCPKLISEAYWKSWEEKDTDTVQPPPDPLLEDPVPLNEADIEQEPFMAGLGAVLTKADRNNTNQIDEEAEAAAGLMQENEPVIYTGITTDGTADWSEDRLSLNLDRQQVDEAHMWLDGRKTVTEVPNQVWTEQFEPEALNTKQREVYDLMERLVMGEEPEPGVHLIDLNGEAGTGKSRLIKTILYQSEMRTGNRSRIRVCAFTNSAARQFVGGKTVHKLLRLDVERGPAGTRCKKQAPLEGKRLQEFQEDLATTWAIIIDEKSMVGCFDLFRIDQRLRQARPQHSHKMFGGFVILLCGDLSQLPPIGDKALYYDGKGVMSPAQSTGRMLFSHFTECYFLTESMRQQGPENEMFRGELRRMGDGTYALPDWYRWDKRSFPRLSEAEKKKFQEDGIKLCSRKVDMVTFNEDGLRRCATPILVNQAEHNNDTAKKANDSDGELPVSVPVARGAAVVLTDNLWPDLGLINGSKGTVTHIVFKEGEHPGNGMPAFILVKFPDYVGPPYIPHLPGTVPICPRTAEWKEGSTKCTRRSFPLLPGYALTIHKSQGMTIDQPVIIDIGPREFAIGLTYTVCTRTRSLENIAFQPMPTFNRIRDIFKDSFKTKQKEMTRRLALAAEREAREGLAGRPTGEQDHGEMEALIDCPGPTVTAEAPANVISPPLETIVIDDVAPDDTARCQPSNAGQVCSYPVGERGNMNHVFMHDYSLLGCGMQLNDVLIKLGLDYFERVLLSTEQRARLHIFDSGRFQSFMHDLSEDQFARAPSDALARAMHARVAHLTSRHSIDLFTKDIVLWPIEHSSHWYLVVGLNLGKPHPAIFTLNSIGNYGEGAILEHIKAYLALENQTLPSRRGQMPAIQTLTSAPPQQTGGIDCGLYLLSSAEAIFRRFDQFSALASSADLGQNWFPSFSPLEMRQRLAEIIENLSAEQGFTFTSWPNLHLS